LASCYELLIAFNGAGFDSLSYGRSAIEPHPQDQFPEFLDVVIDALRDGGEIVQITQPDLSERWWSLSHALFRRLAVHLVDAGAKSASEKITWILDSQLLWDFDTKQERFMLLRNAVSGASAGVRARLLRDVISGPDDGSEVSEQARDDLEQPEGSDNQDEQSDVTRYEIFNLLAWLGQADPAWTEVADARDELAAEHNWSISEHPDLHSWTSSGTWVSQPPFSQEQFDGYIATEGIDRALHRLLAVQYTNHRDGPEWSDALNLIRTSVTESHDIGIAIWDSEELANASDEHRNSIIDAIVQAWSGLTLTAANMDEVLSRLSERASVVESAWSIARFLSEQVRLQAEHLTIEQLARMGTIAQQVWDFHAESVRERSDVDPADLSLNSWPGMVSHFWILEISAKWRADQRGWNGLDDQERLALGRIVAGTPSGAAQSAIPALTRELVFLFNADEAFTVASILPLFGSNIPVNWSWGSFLYHPGWNDGLLERGFYERVLDIVARFDELDQKRGLHRQLLNLVLNIVCFSTLPLDERLRLVNAVVIKDDGQWPARLVRDLIGIYTFGTFENNEPLWADWLRTWMAQRLTGIPRIPTPSEVSAWADLIPYLGVHAKEALTILGNRLAPMSEEYTHPDFNALALSPIIDDFIRHLAARLTASKLSEFGVGLEYRVRDLIDYLTATFGSATVAPLRAAAEEKGINF
jgi:hypothetical protein